MTICFVLISSCSTKESIRPVDELLRARDTGDKQYFIDYLNQLETKDFRIFAYNISHLYDYLNFQYGMIDFEEINHLTEEEKGIYRANVLTLYRAYLDSPLFMNQHVPASNYFQKKFPCLGRIITQEDLGIIHKKLVL